MSNKDTIVSRLLTLPPFAGDPKEPRIRYNRRWMFMYYLTGVGMTLYNTYRHWLVIDDYKVLYEHILKTDGFEACRNADLPIYYGDSIVKDVTHRTDLLVNGNIMLMLYRQSTIGDDERHVLESHMTLTHTQFGFIGNFDQDQFYSEWYVRDPKTGNIERVKLM